MIPETLQSQLDNFVLNFFGTVTKTDTAPGVVSWELPCDLDVGLTTSTRGVDEGVSCYFLRLFREEIAKLAGPKGAAGSPGLAGYSGYTVSLNSFVQPTTASPFVLRALLNPVIKENEIVYVSRSGWYQVLWIDDVGNLTLSLIQPMLGASGTIAAGRVVVPVGPKGANQTGPVGFLGQRGDKGATGPVGGTGVDGEDGSSLTAGPTQQSGDFVPYDIFDLQPYFQVNASVPEAKLVTFEKTATSAIPSDEDNPPDTDDVAKKKRVRFELVVAGKYLFRYKTHFSTYNGDARLYTGLVDTTNPANNVSPDPAGTNKFLPGSYSKSDVHDAGVTIPASSVCIVETTSNYTTVELQAFGKGCRILAPYTTVTWVRLT